MGRFEISDKYTTADIGLRLEGETLEELFMAGADGLFAVILDEIPEREISATRKIELSADDSEQLLVDWLSELLYYFDAEGLIPARINLKIIRSGDGFDLKADVSLCSFDPESDDAGHEVKAMTYYRLKIEKKGNLYTTDVVFDI